MLTLVQKLHHTGLLTLVGLLRLLESVLTTGVNLMTMLRLAGRLFPNRIALVDERERLTYRELWLKAETLAAALHGLRGVRRGHKVAIVCRNHAAAIEALFAASRLGADVYLINPEMTDNQLHELQKRRCFDLTVYDEHLASVFELPALAAKSLSAYHATAPSIDLLSARPGPRAGALPRVASGNIVVMTGGTTGQPKPASRKPSILNFFPPFVALLTRMHLDRYRKVYVATPIYHGYGLASLLMGVMLGAEMYVARRFDPVRVSEQIEENRIEVVTLVPLMLQRLLRYPTGALSSLKCILSGGAALSPTLAADTLGRLGPVLFNLYGTSEAGFCIMATPELLLSRPGSIGRPVAGVRAAILSGSSQQLEAGITGRLCIRSSWTTRPGAWIETGDLAHRDEQGNLFLAGRVDDMIVSGGENVYPIELQNILAQHPAVDSAALFGIPDAEFGQRLKAVIVRRDAALDRETLIAWLKTQAARYQMPAAIEFRDELPYTTLGKLDIRRLQAEHAASG
jgi:acyl-CoA synthetase (AMP-forming)/AMP-acid ligase II